MQILLLAISITAVAGAAFDTPNRIYGGMNAEISDFNFQVSLGVNISNNYIHVCGGSIIGKKWILTAAHCFDLIKSTENWEVVAGISKLQSYKGTDGQRVKIEEIITHPNFTKDIAPHDIAILKLQKKLVYNKNVGEISLPEAGSKPYGCAWLTGWGFINTQLYSDILQKTIVKISSDNECKAIYNEKFKEDANICTGWWGQGCQGDSGGPLSQNGIVIGVVSWGPRECGTGPTVYANVANYIDFINTNMK